MPLLVEEFNRTFDSREASLATLLGRFNQDIIELTSGEIFHRFQDFLVHKQCITTALNSEYIYRRVPNRNVVGEDCWQTSVSSGKQEARPGGAGAADAAGYVREHQLRHPAVVVLHVHHERAVRRAPRRRRFLRHLLCKHIGTISCSSSQPTVSSSN